MKTSFFEREFIEKYKSRPNKKGQLKRPDEQLSDQDQVEEENEPDANDPAQRQKVIMKLLGSSFLPEASKEYESYADRQAKFFARFLPETANYNQHKIDKLFQVHQMEELVELKDRYDEITYILDEQECSQAYKMDLVKELHDVETAYERFSNQIEHLNNLIDATQYSVQK